MKKFKIIIISFIIIFVVCLLINGIYCTNTLEIKKYNYKTEKLNTKLRIVFISDLHNKEFGEKNRDLVNKIKEQSPDFIAVGGDMVTRYFDDDSVMEELFSQISDIAPTYCVLGNHERDLSDKLDFKNDINNTGALLLDNELIEFEKNREKILIGGLSDFPYYEFDAPDYETPERYFWDNFCEKSKNNFSILLHHQPEYIGDIAKDSNIDLILCGHTHGGLIQIPFIGGLFAPNQGLFPKYDKGEFNFNDTKMIVSSGLGNSNPVPRINNCAEITVVDINQ